MDISQMRREYTRTGLCRASLHADPVRQFSRWFEEAVKAELSEPNAMALATVGGEGSPALRTVLLKYFDKDGFVFFTNKDSRKAEQIRRDPRVALIFLWLELERQLSIEGVAEEVSIRESLAYFLRRPRDSQLEAWVSPQSRVISSRKLLELKWEEMKHKFAGGQIPLPSFWGGYRVVPVRFEFWQGRPKRLHDRFEYVKEGDGSWVIRRLAP
jgi:pyridoxamine 5'-phosphate oxidase